ncbi:MAG: nucleotidyltransferase family protein [Longimicrobiales bacterium]
MSASPPALDLDAAALEAASRRLGLRRVVLFGSYATGEPTPDAHSDVDVAVSLASPRDRSAFWEIHNELAPIFADRPLDLVFLADADPLFRWEIVREGILL